MGNSRVVKFTKDGKFIKQWGGHGSEPGQFEVPHALAFDAQGRLFARAKGFVQPLLWERLVGLATHTSLSVLFPAHHG